MTTTTTEHAFVKDRIFEAVGYTPHAKQQLIHDSRTRMKVASCGRRFGKSECGGNELVPEGLATYSIAEDLNAIGKRYEFWIVGPEYSDAEKEFRIAYNAFKRIDVPFDKPGTYNNPESGDMHISLWNGAFEIHAKSAKYPSTLVGEGLKGVILGEAAKLKERVWTKFIRPTLADHRGWALMTSTPEGKNWFYRMWQRGQNPNDAQWASWRFPSWLNPIVFPLGIDDPEILDMAKDMTNEKFNQEVAADFTEFVGRVFKDFDEEVHVSDLDYDPRYPLYACCDYGWTNPFVWLFVQVDVWDNVNVLAEYRAINRDINDIAKDLLAIPLISQVKQFFPDPAAPGDTAVLEKALHVKANPNTGGELKHRLEYIRQALRVRPEHAPDDAEDKRSKLLIDRSCNHLIFEMNEYRWPETKEESLRSEPEKPMDKDDHGPEALGRFFRGYYGALSDDGNKARPKVRRAKVG